jgi:anti-sigma factor RsiW
MTSADGSIVRDWELERYRLGELSPGEHGRIHVLLATDAQLRAQLAALETADAAFLEQHPAPAFAAQVRDRAGAHPKQTQSSRPRLVLAFAGTGAAVLLGAGLFFVLRDAPRTPEGDRIKGLTPHVLLFKKTVNGPVRLAPTSLARERDVIQVAYQAAGRHYGVIVSVDARGVVTRHLPATGAQAAALRPGTVALPDAYQLDDAPRWECFYLVTAETPFDVEDIVSAIRQVPRGSSVGPPARLSLPTGLDQEVFVLRKAAQP